jgi:hypothetical protein
VFAIDPGPEKSAFCVVDRTTLELLDFGHITNEELMTAWYRHAPNRPDIRIEMIASYGMAVGASVFETCVWIGRFMERFDPGQIQTKRITRNTVKNHLCLSSRAKDANVRAVLIDKYEQVWGSGCRKKGGILHGVSKDVWAALGVAVTAIETEATMKGMEWL